MNIEIKAKVSMPEGTKIFQGDNYVDEIVIKTDRFYKTIDMADLNGYLKIKYVDDSCNQVKLQKRETTEDYVLFFAKIDKNITKRVGTLICQPYFTDDKYTICMSTSCFPLEIESSIQVYETIEQILLPSTLEELEYELKVAIQEFQKDIYATEGSDNAITSNAVYTMFKSVDLGAFKQEEYDNVLLNLRESGIYKISLLNEESTIKETRLVCVFNYAFGFCTQTLFYFDTTDHKFTKIATRNLSYLTGEFIEPWVEDKIITKSSLEETLGFISGELDSVLGV